MKRIKFSLVTMAIVAAVCCAFATAPKHDICDFEPQYYYDGSNYWPAGVYGYNFGCDDDPAITCSYYKPDPVGHPNTYATCHLGDYIYVQINKSTAPPKK
jgi:hypothetical protein